MLASHKHVVVALRDALLERDELVGDEITGCYPAAVRLASPDELASPGAAAGSEVVELPAPVVDIRS